MINNDVKEIKFIDSATNEIWVFLGDKSGIEVLANDISKISIKTHEVKVVEYSVRSKVPYVLDVYFNHYFILVHL